MNYNVISEKQNDLLKRKEIKVEIDHLLSATPAKADIIKELATAYSVPEENIVIDYVFTQNGIGKSVVKLKIFGEKPKIRAKKVKETKKGENEAQTGKVQ